MQYKTILQEKLMKDKERIKEWFTTWKTKKKRELGGQKTGREKEWRGKRFEKKLQIF